jgi:hypothetical protein
MKQCLIISLLFFATAIQAESSLPDSPHIALTGTAQVKAHPDIAVLHLVVESTEKRSLDAKDEVDRRVNTLLDGLKRFSVDNKNVSASSISTSPNYTYNKGNQREITGYKASRTLKITLNKLSKLNALMDFTLSVDINQIRNIELKSSQEDVLKAEAIELAVKNAKAKGAALANSFDAKLGKVYSINATQNNSYYQYGENQATEQKIMVTGSRSAAFEPQGQYLQENIIFNASINVVFNLDVD